MKVIDGQNLVLGRIASYTAKELLKGEEINIINCNEILISGNKKDIKENFHKKRGRVGSGQKGPKYSRSPEKFVKRTVRGMLPEHRFGKGKIAFKKLRCYNKIPEELKENKYLKLTFAKKPIKYIKIKELLNQNE